MTHSDAIGCIVLPVEPQQADTLRPVLSRGYAEGRAVFAQLHRDTTGAYWCVSIVSPKTWSKVLALLNADA